MIFSEQKQYILYIPSVIVGLTWEPGYATINIAGSYWKYRPNLLLLFVCFLFYFRTMSSFKQYVQNMEGRQALNQLLMYLEIEQYNAILPAKKMQKTQQATHIYK